jgi:RNA-directed DNA polymerase
MINYKCWYEIPWKSINVFVYDLQRKTYYHAEKNEIGLVRHYQHKLVKLIEARLLFVRSVSQDNRGKVTAGIDGIAKLDLEQRLNLTKKLIMNGNASKNKKSFYSKT